MFKIDYWKFLLFFGIFLFFFLPPIDTDLGWHLRYGDYFWQTGKLLTTNQFTLIMPNYRWPNSYGLAQIIAALIYKLFSFWGLSLLNSLIFLTSFYFIYLYFQKNLYKTSTLLLIISLFSWPVFNLGWRPQMYSFLGMVLLFFILQNIKYLFFLPLLFFLWANLHGGFILGITGLFIYLIIQFILSTKQSSSKQKLLAVFILSILATLINPYGIKIYWEAWHHLQVPLQLLIAEWIRPSFIIALIISVIFLLTIILVIYEKNKNRMVYFLLLTLCVFFYLGLSAVRNIPFFILNLFFLSNQLKPMQKLSHNINFIYINKAIIILFLIFAACFQLPKTAIADSHWTNYCLARQIFPLPCSAVDFIKKNSLRGNFYNTYEWGGFLEWQLPDSKFFVDGRMPAWPTPSNESPYSTYINIIQVQPSWQDYLETYKIDHLIIGNGTFLDLELSDHSQKYPWKELYRDQIAVIYKKQ